MFRRYYPFVVHTCYYLNTFLITSRTVTIKQKSARSYRLYSLLPSIPLYTKKNKKKFLRKKNNRENVHKVNKKIMGLTFLSIHIITYRILL